MRNFAFTGPQHSTRLTRAFRISLSLEHQCATKRSRARKSGIDSESDEYDRRPGSIFPTRVGARYVRSVASAYLRANGIHQSKLERHVEHARIHLWNQSESAFISFTKSMIAFQRFPIFHRSCWQWNSDRRLSNADKILCIAYAAVQRATTWKYVLSH